MGPRSECSRQLRTRSGYGGTGRLPSLRHSCTSTQHCRPLHTGGPGARGPAPPCPHGWHGQSTPGSAVMWVSAGTATGHTAHSRHLLVGGQLPRVRPSQVDLSSCLQPSHTDPFLLGTWLTKPRRWLTLSLSSLSPGESVAT